VKRMDPRIVRALLAGAAVAGAASAVVAASGGGSIEIGPLLIRSHDARRPGVAAIILTACAYAAGRGAVRAALEWWWNAIERHASFAAALIAAGAVATGLVWGTFVAGGSDSYCYLNQAELFARGAVREFEPLAIDPAWPGNVWSFAPAGHIPASNDPGSYVPICPAGYPFLLAGARLLFGRTAMFWITPICGGLLVYLAFVLGRRIAGPAAGLLGAVLTASSPIVLYQIVQPMNDVPAAAVWTAALVVASTKRFGDTARAILAGAVCGLAITIRPNLVPLAAVLGLGVALFAERRTLRQQMASLALFTVAVLPGILVVMAIQAAMYGSPLSSGYGDLSAMFAVSNIIPNLLRYPRWLVLAHTPLVAAALAAPFGLGTEARRFAAWLLGFAAATFALYLPYVVFEAWWYLRFVLPAIPPLLALTSGVVVALLRRLRPDVCAIAFVAATVSLAIIYVGFAVRHDAFFLKDHEWRFRSAGEYVATLPANAIVITGHHTGSVRFYSGRRSVGWGDIDPGRLDEALRFVRAKGLKPYLLFTEWEEPEFRQRFSRDRLGALGWPPSAEIDRHARIYDPDDHDRHERGERIRTARIETTRSWR
jgi:hypothetical protein